ncbi:MAG: choice-of-anchor D domain-containing protein [Gammaproteobacteria bacterium]
MLVSSVVIAPWDAYLMVNEIMPIPIIAVEPSSIDFGSVIQPLNNTHTLDIINNGNDDLIIDHINLCTGTSSEFFINALQTTTITPRTSISITVHYTPTDSAINGDIGCLEIISNDASSPVMYVDLAGVGTDDLESPVITAPPDITVEAQGLLTLIDIGTATATDNVQVNGLVSNDAPASGEFMTGTTIVTWTATDLTGNIGSALQTITVQDTIPPDLTLPDDIETIADTATGKQIFFSVNSVDQSDPLPEISCSHSSGDEFPIAETTVNCTATDTSDNQTSASFKVAVRSATINLLPNALDFGTVAVGETASHDFRIFNGNPTAIEITAIESCTPGSAFSFATLAAPVQVETNTHITLSIRYTPILEQTDINCFNVLSNDPVNPAVQLSVTGTGNLQIPDISLNKVSVDFGETEIGKIATQSVLISNIGNTTLTVDSVALCGSSSDEFSFTPLTVSSIEPGSTTTLEMMYTPIGTGIDSACFLINSNDPDTGQLQLDINASGRYPAGRLGDFVWRDLNSNGRQDTGEPGLANVAVNMWLNCDPNTQLTTLTDNDGAFSFTNLPEGNYQLEFIKPVGYNFSPAANVPGNNIIDSNPNPLTGLDTCQPLANNQISNGLDAGLYIDTGQVADTLTVIRAIYFSADNRIWIKADSDASPPGSSAITATIVSGGIETVLGPVQWNAGKNAYQQTFRNLGAVPDSIILTSATGGSVTAPVEGGGGGSSTGSADTLSVVRAIYFSADNRIWIKADSDVSPAGSSSITATIINGGVETVLGQVQWNAGKNAYQQTFKNISAIPDKVKLESNLGGTITGSVDVQ